MLKKIGIGTVFLAAVAGAGALLVAQAAPKPGAATAPVLLDEGTPFGRICKTTPIAEARPDPAWMGASFAGDNCVAPKMPAPIDGYTASREQVVAGMEAAKNYAAASDAFQRCILDVVAARKAQAAKDAKPISPSFVLLENYRIAASEKNKKRVDDRTKMAIIAFNEYGSGCPPH